MVERRCRYCEQVFQPSKLQPGQSVCSGPECQRRRRADSRRQKIVSDAEYRQVCQDACRKWRARHPDYWRQRRERTPAAVERNRQQQRVRDHKRRLRDLANNNSAFDLKHSAAQVWLMGSGLEHLANNNSARAQIWVLEALPPRRSPAERILPTTTLWRGRDFGRIKGSAHVLTTEQINDLHRLYWSERWPIRKIERHLRMGWHTIRKYLDAPAQGPAARPRASKLDPFKATIAEWLEKDATVSGAVMEQRLRPLGYSGGHTILRDYLKQVRSKAQPNRAFIRMEPAPGERFEVDWGHFGALNYSGDQRKLYAFALVEAHSRMLYLEFTHSQSFETFVRCHQHAFAALGGIAREIAYDNLATAVAEHDGRLVRFLPRFLAFAREYGFYPRACNPAAGWEKGKVERAIGYVRQSFWPLREFTHLDDVNRQARQWLSEIANQRQHRETRQRPVDRFQPTALKPLPVIPYDHRDQAEALVHKDLRIRFDGNRYCVPHRYVGRHLIVKADSGSVTFYDRVHEVVSYPRSWQRGQTFGADRFEAELAEMRPAARKSRAQQRLFQFLDGLCSAVLLEAYLRDMADTDRALSRQLTELLELIRQYGPEAVAGAIEKAAAARAFGAGYVANILRQQQSPRRPQPQLVLRDPRLNELATDPLSLLEYDAFILTSGKDPDDSAATKTEPTEPVHYEPPTGDDSD